MENGEMNIKLNTIAQHTGALKVLIIKLMKTE
jgi:hypothetical protein